MWDTKESDRRAQSVQPESRTPAVMTARKQDAGSAKTNAGRAPVPTTSSFGSNIDYAKEREAIEQAIINFYNFARHSSEIRLAPHLKYTYWGLEIDEINLVTVKNVHGKEVDVSAEYVASPNFGNWAVKFDRKSRFLLKKNNGSYFVVKMWADRENDLRARSDRNSESRIPAAAPVDLVAAAKRGTERATTRKAERAPAPIPHDPTIDYAKDRAAIEQAISDYYFLAGHLDDVSDDPNDYYYGSEIFDFARVTVQKVDGNEIDVLAEFLASSNSDYGAVSLSRKSRFLLRKQAGILHGHQDVERRGRVISAPACQTCAAHYKPDIAAYHHDIPASEPVKIKKLSALAQ